ncbi:putative spermidine/putrescine transport system permease protein [Salinihabitans flavidus]|uniref:Putative spermidine/putrescine transport system permease protein n=1 Tax=Salinihabitans flavidus TaxID=569882 RepID=A0A1H8P5H7_9RHOB|nr:ABC transporter permease [Salinihabitans flavidus]SEO37190.1 putative spermidine/putrescine transport system permease protein [Salinihabitans flavidus]
MSGMRQNSTPGWLPFVPVAWLLLFFLVPFAIMLTVSVAHRVPGGFYEPGFEFDSYLRFFSVFFGRILLTSILISAGAAVICVLLAFPFTLSLARMKQRGQTIVLVILLSVLSLSEVIIGFSLSTLLSKTAGVGNLLAALGFIEESRAYTPSLFALMAGMCYLALPYSVLVLYPPVSRLDPELGEAARMMGASPFQTFRTVTVPMLRKPMMGALILVFVFTLGVYLLPQVLGQPQHWTLSVHITDQAIFQSNLPFAAAMAVLLLLVSLAMVGLSLLLGRDKVTDT